MAIRFGRGYVDEEGYHEVSKVRTCDFCGRQGTDVVEEDYYDALFEYDTTRYGCKDKSACKARQQAADLEWKQATGRAR